MATCYLTFSEVVKTTGPWVLKPDKCVTEVITLSSSNQKSTQVGTGQIDYVRVLSDADCWLCIGADSGLLPNALTHTASVPIKANVVEHFRVPTGHKVAVTTG